jgi:DNA gyrase subunit A
LIATRKGKSIRFDEAQVRAMGRSAAGVKAVQLDDDDRVVGFCTTDPERQQVLTICERGYGKRTPLEDFRAQNRGGKGIILIDASDRNGPVVGIALVRTDDQVMLVTDRGQTIRTNVSEIRETGRNAQGVRVMHVGEDERVVAIEALGEQDDDELPEVEEGTPEQDTTGGAATEAAAEGEASATQADTDEPADDAGEPASDDVADGSDEEP